MKEKRYPYVESPEKIAEALGHGRYTITEKSEYIKNNAENFFRNIDFVSVATYTELFTTLDLDNKTVLDVGAGYSIAPTDLKVPPMIVALQKVNPKVTLIPFDYNHNRSKSWLLLDSAENSDNIKLEPVTGDATSLPFADSTLDGYISSNLINEPTATDSELHFVHKLFQEAYRVLKPGGFLIITSFGYFYWELNSGATLCNDNIDTEEIVTKEQVAKLLAQAGFITQQDLPLDTSLMSSTIKERLAQTTNALSGGVQDACAFVAYKPL